LVNVPIVIVTFIAGQVLIPRLDVGERHRFDLRGVLISTAGVTALVLAIIEGPQWGWSSVGVLGCFAAAALLLWAFAVLELRTEWPLLDVRVFKIPRFTGGAISISVAFYSLFGFIFLITQYFQFIKGYSTLSAGVHTLPFAIVAAVFTPLAAVVALKVGSRIVVAVGLLFMATGLVLAAFNSESGTAYWGPIIISMIFLALGLSSITAPTSEAVMGSVSDDQFGAAAAVNNTTRELGGTLGVAVFGSVFASAYAPKIISAFKPLPIPAGPKAGSHQSIAVALAVVQRAPKALQPALRAVTANAFHSGLEVAALSGSVVAVIGAALAFKLLPGRETAPEIAMEAVLDEPEAVVGVSGLEPACS
jgi:MFS transporter